MAIVTSAMPPFGPLDLSGAYGLGNAPYNDYSADPHNGTVTQHSATQFTVDFGAYAVVYGGISFGGYDSAGVPTSGTLTTYSITRNGDFQMGIQGMSLSISSFLGFAATNDNAGMLAQIFAHNDTMTAGSVSNFASIPGTASLYGYAGDDTLAFVGINGNTGGIFDGGSGIDTVDFSGWGAPGNDVSINVDLAAGVVTFGIVAFPTRFETCPIVNVENVIGWQYGGVITGDGKANALTGGAGGDHLFGGGGNDILDGKGGGDVMTGGAGNDTYIVDNASDVITEDLNAGTDTVNAALNYTLGANIENLIITGAATFAGGNELANVLTGNALVNTLSGSTGNDTLIGGAGADKLNGGDGVDAASYATATAGVTANLFDHTLNSGDAAGDIFSSIEVLIGSAFNDTLTGSSAANRIDGGLGADHMIGGNGNDTYIVDNVGDVVSETAVAGGVDKVQASISYQLGTNLENLTLTGSAAINGTGNSLANTIYGNSAANTLNGGTGDDTLLGNGGHDILKGGAGGDHFVFSSLNAADSDTISDFSHADDTLYLDNSVFTALGPDGALSSNAFWSSTTGVAHDADDRIIYNSTTGQLFYDADGNGAGAAVLIATLTTHPTITVDDIFTI